MAEQLEPWVATQRRTFSKWINSRLRKKYGDEAPKIESIEHDFKTGEILIKLVHALDDKVKIPSYNKNPKMRPHLIDNCSLGLDMAKKASFELPHTSPMHLVDCDLKMVLGMVWTIVVTHQIKGINVNRLRGKEGLLLWCRRKTNANLCASYSKAGIDVKNFTSCWSNGLAFAALLHAHRPDLLDFEALLDENVKQCPTALDEVAAKRKRIFADDEELPFKACAVSNLEKVFAIAEKELDIDPLLEPADLYSPDFHVKPDERSVMTYISEWFNVLGQKTASGEGDSDDTKRKRLIARDIDAVLDAKVGQQRDVAALQSGPLAEFESLLRDHASSADQLDTTNASLDQDIAQRRQARADAYRDLWRAFIVATQGDQDATVGPLSHATDGSNALETSMADINSQEDAMLAQWTAAKQAKQAQDALSAQQTWLNTALHVPTGGETQDANADEANSVVAELGRILTGARLTAVEQAVDQYCQQEAAATTDGDVGSLPKNRGALYAKRVADVKAWQAEHHETDKVATDKATFAKLLETRKAFNEHCTALNEYVCRDIEQPLNALYVDIIKSHGVAPGKKSKKGKKYSNAEEFAAELTRLETQVLPDIEAVRHKLVALNDKAQTAALGQADLMSVGEILEELVLLEELDEDDEEDATYALLMAGFQDKLLVPQGSLCKSIDALHAATTALVKSSRDAMRKAEDTLAKKKAKHAKKLKKQERAKKVAASLNSTTLSMVARSTFERSVEQHYTRELKARAVELRQLRAELRLCALSSDEEIRRKQKRIVDELHQAERKSWVNVLADDLDLTDNDREPESVKTVRRHHDNFMALSSAEAIDPIAEDAVARLKLTQQVREACVSVLQALKQRQRDIVQVVSKEQDDDKADALLQDIEVLLQENTGALWRDKHRVDELEEQTRQDVAEGLVQRATALSLCQKVEMNWCRLVQQVKARRKVINRKKLVGDGINDEEDEAMLKLAEAEEKELGERTTGRRPILAEADKARFREEFVKADKDGSGYIEQDELVAVLHELNESNVSAERVEILLADYGARRQLLQHSGGDASGSDSDEDDGNAGAGGAAADQGSRTATDVYGIDQEGFVELMWQLAVDKRYREEMRAAFKALARGEDTLQEAYVTETLGAEDAQHLLQQMPRSVDDPTTFDYNTYVDSMFE